MQRETRKNAIPVFVFVEQFPDPNADESEEVKDDRKEPHATSLDRMSRRSEARILVHPLGFSSA